MYNNQGRATRGNQSTARSSSSSSLLLRKGVVVLRKGCIHVSGICTTTMFPFGVEAVDARPPFLYTASRLRPRPRPRARPASPPLPPCPIPPSSPSRPPPPLLSTGVALSAAPPILRPCARPSSIRSTHLLSLESALNASFWRWGKRKERKRREWGEKCGEHPTRPRALLERKRVRRLVVLVVVGGLLLLQRSVLRRERGREGSCRPSRVCSCGRVRFSYLQAAARHLLPSLLKGRLPPPLLLRPLPSRPRSALTSSGLPLRLCQSRFHPATRTYRLHRLRAGQATGRWLSVPAFRAPLLLRFNDTLHANIHSPRGDGAEVNPPLASTRLAVTANRYLLRLPVSMTL
ncbi:hypothetical protein MARPO_0134s0015 [Marchantia polymorpha]|uniref:Uncharacterized protein n=1 Tax=Marchantia polymorpha TaxID=3197 RepID=A0A2R6W7I4_MARPO|nr:hypothetical protein MARPO_0134s0015 [Marchantia polymorpha]|eukprot:PTQ29803.1 hypothetical protein MARPO_0134s0015 [Marchantia polymorpha]